MSVCLNHTDRPANTRCSACHKPICNECIVMDTGAIYCSQACAQGAARFRGKYVPEERPGFFARLASYCTSLLGLAFVVSIVVVVGAYGLKIPFFINLLKKIGL